MVYKAWHENGFVQYYVNRSPNLLLTEMVIFELENLQIDGLEGEKQVFVRVGPSEEQLIKLINVSEGERKLSSKVVEKKIVLYEKPADNEELDQNEEN